SDRDRSTGIRFSPHLFWFPFFKIKPVAGAVEMWESGCLVPDFQARWKGWETRLAFGVFHAFHGAAFPRRPLGVFGAQRRCSFFTAAFFTHRLAAHLEAVGVVHQPVEDA